MGPQCGGPQKPIGFAHRGARSEQRDNTLPAFRRALELGATGLESDAWVTADGTVVLDHDGLVRAPWPNPWRRRPIGALTAGALPGHIPRLEDLYRSCGAAYQLSLDVKDLAAAPAIVEVARTFGAPERLWLCSPDRTALSRWRALDARVRLVWSTKGVDVAGPGGPDAVTALSATGIDAVNLRAGQWTPALVQACRSAGLAVLAWDAQTPEVLSRLVGLGVDGVFSDHVDRMMAVLAGSEPVQGIEGPHPHEGPADDEAAGNRPDHPGVG